MIKKISVLFLLLTALLVCAASAEMLPPDMDSIWDIEDHYEEAAEPFLNTLYNGDERLGYDRESNTFYCTLGMEQGGDWPEIHIGSKDENIQLMWVDEYQPDACSDAIENDLHYEAFAFNGEQYEYFNVVFTGLPIVVISGDETIGAEYVPCTVDIAADGYEPLFSQAQTHLRAGGDVNEFPKVSYRVELHRTTKKGKDKKNKVSVLGMEKDSDWVLLACYKDTTRVRNYVGWKFWNGMHEEGSTYLCPLQCRMVELFVQDSYNGLYTLMERVEPKRELKRIGADPDRDCVFRIIHDANIDPERPTLAVGSEAPRSYFELRSKPDDVTVEEAFEPMDVFARMTITDPSDPRYLQTPDFIEAVDKYLDVQEQIDYYLFIQLSSLWDNNVENNVYFWCVKDADGNVKIHVSPWDLDQAMCLFNYNNRMTIVNRILNLNLHDAQTLLWQSFDRLREGGFSDDSIYSNVTEAQDLVNRSGAYLRESAKWMDGAQTLDMKESLGIMDDRMGKVENEMDGNWPRTN